jgi:hypothetical protein
MFFKVFNSDWLINYIELSQNISSRCYSLTLLGLFLETDRQYYVEFCDKRGYKILETLLSYSLSYNLTEFNY